MKRSQDVDFDALFDSLNTGDSPVEPRAEDDDAPADPVDDDWDDDDED
jgi:hypothetical protein